MEHKLYSYTPYNDRSLVYEGTFIEGDDVDINIGDEILVFHQCKDCNEHILMKVVDKTVAYYFGMVGTTPKPIYDYSVACGGSYKCNIKHVSQYDQIVRTCICNITH